MDWDEAVQLLKSHLEVAWTRMMAHYDSGRKDQDFAVRDMVYLKIQPYRRSTLHRLPTRNWQLIFMVPSRFWSVLA